MELIVKGYFYFINIFTKKANNKDIIYIKNNKGFNKIINKNIIIRIDKYYIEYF